MPVYSSQSGELNTSYHDNGEFDYAVLSAYFDSLNDTLARQGLQGGDTDRLDSFAVVGRNSIAIRAMLKDETLDPASQLLADIESQNEDQFSVVKFFERADGESKADATTRWIEAFSSEVEAIVTQNALPFTLPVTTTVTVISDAPGFFVPQEWVAP